MSLYVKFWGTRGSIPTPGYRTARYGGNTPCVEIRSGATLIACDAGSGLRELGMDLVRRFENEPITVHLMLSHGHWDHIQGFPFFPPAYLPSTTIHVYGPSEAGRTAYQLLTAQMASAHFPVAFSALPARVLPGEFDRGAARIGDVDVRTLAHAHPGGGLGFGFVAGGRKVVYLTDNEIDRSLLNAAAVAANPAAVREFPADLVDFVRGADLFVADAQYADSEYPQKVGWGHPSASAVVDLALRADVKQLALFHHDPMQSDADVDQKVAACLKRVYAGGWRETPQVFGAREGVELKIV